MHEVDRMLAEHACARLCTRFHQLIDNGRNAEILSLFASGGIWNHRTGALTTREQIAAYLAEKSTYPVTRHLISNLIIDVIDSTHARGSLNVLVYYAEPSRDGGPAPLNVPVLLVQYDDEFVLTSDGWRFASRTTKQIFKHESFSTMIHTKADEFRATRPNA